MIWRLVFLLAILPSPLLVADSYGGWPEGWKAAYLRFEGFKQAKEKTFPKSNLEVFSDGSMTHGVPFQEGTTEHLNYCAFGSGKGATLRYPSLEKDPLPGVYAVGLKFCTQVSSYQYLYPFLWVEVSYADGKKKVRKISDPAVAERRWPSEQLLKFIDFHAFLSGNPLNFHLANQVLKPSLELGLTPDGILVRDQVDPALDRLLRWRVYCNGELIEDRPVNGEMRYDANRGTGEYHAFLGVEGPSGFMPVSNYLHYPLFSAGEERALMFPSMDGRGFPKFFSVLFTPEQMAELVVKPEQHKRGDGYNSNAVYGIPDLEADSAHRDLYEFWVKWSWEIWQLKNNPKSELWRVYLKS